MWTDIWPDTITEEQAQRIRTEIQAVPRFAVGDVAAVLDAAHKLGYISYHKINENVENARKTEWDGKVQEVKYESEREGYINVGDLRRAIDSVPSHWDIDTSRIEQNFPMGSSGKRFANLRLASEICIDPEKERIILRCDPKD